MEIIESELCVEIPPENKAVVKRVIHCTADFDYAVNLAAAAAKLGCEIHCFMSDPDIAEIAKERGCTRAVASMEKAAELTKPLIFAIGNAPTALLELCDLIAAGRVKPELVIGVPVGFVNILEAALWRRECRI